MKKNLFMSMLAIAGMLFATSCSQDELLNEPTTDDYVSAKFTHQMVLPPVQQSEMAQKQIRLLVLFMTKKVPS